jgi:UDP-N-acetylmuramoylalanine--D-glutamate ligase
MQKSPDSRSFLFDEDKATQQIRESLRQTDRWFNTLRSYDVDDSGFSLPATLAGPHNKQNATAAKAVCRALGLTEDDIQKGLSTYPGLPHRMERIREKGGVIFVNDSKATNPTATAPALAAFEKIRWICGGQAKTDNLDECAPHFGHVRKAYTIGEAGDLFARLLSPHIAVAKCQTLERAVGEAAAEAESGDTVLLSPACASFDQFRDFEDRGDQFRALVEGL